MPQILRCLGLREDGTGPATAVGIRYRTLPKGTFARVQPVASSFREEVLDLKALLEREMQAAQQITPPAASTSRPRRAAASWRPSRAPG